MTVCNPTNIKKTKQSPLTSNHLTQKKTITYIVGNPDPGLGQAPKCCRIKMVNGMPTISPS